MRWGIRDDAEDDHTTIETCMREIQACQKVSTGPTFVVSTHFHQQGHCAIVYIRLAYKLLGSGFHNWL